EAGQLQLNVMEPVIGQAMFESIHILSNACYNLLEKCVNGITACGDRMMKLEFSIYRYNPDVDNAPRMQDYTLEGEEGRDMMLLD
ncbi:hypothetical protein MJL48_32610, partial [Salmonella enterica subsp. enterica serovar Kentucky]|nr:hypothetical protein [Salmonella enterica subsp. enterica serovar Kentucky]